MGRVPTKHVPAALLAIAFGLILPVAAVCINASCASLEGLAEDTPSPRADALADNAAPAPDAGGSEDGDADSGRSPSACDRADAFFCDDFEHGFREWQLGPPSSSPAPAIVPLDRREGHVLRAELKTTGSNDKSTLLLPLPSVGFRLSFTALADDTLPEGAIGGGNNYLIAQCLFKGRDEDRLSLIVSRGGPGDLRSYQLGWYSVASAGFTSLARTRLNGRGWHRFDIDVPRTGTPTFAVDNVEADLEGNVAVPANRSVQLEIGVVRPNNPIGPLHVDYDDVIVVETPSP